MCVLTRTRSSRLLAWLLSSSVRGSSTFTSSERCSLSIRLWMYSCSQTSFQHLSASCKKRHGQTTSRRFTFSRVSTVSLSTVSIGRCWYTPLISRTSGRLLIGRWAAEPPDRSLRVRPRPNSVPNGGPGLFFCGGGMTVSVRLRAWRRTA